MGTRRSFIRMLPHTCTIETWTTVADDGFGQPIKVWSTLVADKKCRLRTLETGRPWEVFSPTRGEMIAAEFQAFFALDDDVWDSTNKRPIVTEQDRLVFTAPINITLNVELVSERAGMRRSHHLEIFCNQALG